MSSRSGTNRSYAERLAGGRPNVTITIPVETLAKMDRIAAARGVPRSTLIAEVFDELDERAWSKRKK